MSHNTGECKVNSPIECECIDFNFDQYDQFSQWSKKGVTKIKGEIMVCIEVCQIRNVCRFYLFPPQKNITSHREITCVLERN